MDVLNIANQIPVGYVNDEPIPDAFTSDRVQHVLKFVNAEVESAKKRQHGIRQIWNQCWALYRGKENFEDKQEWQSKLVLPEAFNSVKQATNAITRMLELSRKPWELSPVNPDDEVSRIHGARLESLVRYFLDNAGYLQAFQEGLEAALITGLGVWKIWWSLDKRHRFEIENIMGNEGPERQLKRVETLEGNLKIRAVDPYNFYWIRGGGLNKWLGTIEDSYVNKFQLQQMADDGLLDPEAVRGLIGQMAATPRESSYVDAVRFDTPSTVHGSSFNQGMGLIRLREYYGPLLDEEGRLWMESAYVAIADEKVVLKLRENPYWHNQPPYVAFSPLIVPFREEGVGIIEMTREVDKTLSRLANMSVDTLAIRLTPTFEGYPDAYEDPNELDSGMVPGKILKKSRMGTTLPGLQPVPCEDISSGAVQLYGMLERAHQKGSLISEIQQGIPRWRGVQTATEVSTKAAQENSFIAALAREIDERALKPIVELSMDTVLQFLETSQDPRIASILGVGVEEIGLLDPIRIMEIVQGDYILKVHGINEQLDKSETLANLVQFMNIVGQNDMWAPFLNKTELLKRIIESFPSLRDSDRLLNDPETIEAQRMALQNSQLTPEIIRTIPGLLRTYAELARTGMMPQGAPRLAQITEQQLQEESRKQAEQQQVQEELQQLQVDATRTELEAQIAENERIKAGKEPVA